MGLASSSMAQKRATKLKGKAVANAPNVVPPETGFKSTGVASISKRITANRKGKAIMNLIMLQLPKQDGQPQVGKRKKYKKMRKPTALASLGGPTYLCQNCNATMWYEERNNKGNKDQDPTFSLCCQQGKVLLPRFKDTPEPLKRLLDYTQPATSAFRDLIRVYNELSQNWILPSYIACTHTQGMLRLRVSFDNSSYARFNLRPPRLARTASAIRMLDAQIVTIDHMDFHARLRQNRSGIISQQSIFGDWLVLPSSDYCSFAKLPEAPSPKGSSQSYTRCRSIRALLCQMKDVFMICNYYTEKIRGDLPLDGGSIFKVILIRSILCQSEEQKRLVGP
ncbi:hypothetical protein Tco_0598534 [Tanacetum coccineum]